MAYITWIKTLFITLLISSAFIMSINYIIDPMQQYRISSFYPIDFTIKKQRYLNAGLAKNYDYDSIVLGTSHIANFSIPEIQNTLDFKKPIKLCIFGGSAREQSVTLQTAIKNNKNLKNIIWGLDISSFKGKTTRVNYGKRSFPMYLYDQNILNDYRYLFSFETLKKSSNALWYPYISQKKPKFNYNRMYEWKNEKKFTLNNVLKSWKKAKKNYHKRDKKKFTTIENFKSSFNFNFLNIIKNNPQINFKIFLPPYSILKFKVLDNDLFDDRIKFKKYIFNSIGYLPNVKIYDFQMERNITHNLYNYKDLSHYHQKINTWMIKQIKENNYLLTKENINESIENLREQIKNYDLNESYN